MKQKWIQTQGSIEEHEAKVNKFDELHNVKYSTPLISMIQNTTPLYTSVLYYDDSTIGEEEENPYPVRVQEPIRKTFTPTRHRCSKCNKAINSQQVVEYSIKRYKQALCFDCQGIVKAEQQHGQM